MSGQRTPIPDNGHRARRAAGAQMAQFEALTRRQDVVKLQGGPGSVCITPEASTTRLFGSLAMHIEYTRAEIDRFYSYVDMSGDCWLWTLSTHPTGYGHFTVSRNGKSYKAPAHRAAWVMLYGPVDDDLVMDHLCRVRHCVRQDHLQPVTDRINTLRGVSAPAQNARKKLCIRGHDDWVVRLPKGDRSCRTCSRILGAKARARRREARRSDA
jgi:hypothetical protein